MLHSRLAAQATRKRHQLRVLFEQLARQQGIEGTVVIQAEEEADNILTNREQEVLRYVAAGMTNNEIAQKLTISPRTVETHRSNMMHKLEITTQAELIRYAFQQGIAKLNDDA